MALEYETSGDFWAMLDQLGVALLVTREYEHFLLLARWQRRSVAIGNAAPASVGRLRGSRRRSLVVSSTRTPNQIMWFRPVGRMHGTGRSSRRSRAAGRDRLPPSVTRVLPGTLYIHDVVMVDGDLFVTATGHNFVAEIDRSPGGNGSGGPQCSTDRSGRVPGELAAAQLHRTGPGPRPTPT